MQVNTFRSSADLADHVPPLLPMVLFAFLRRTQPDEIYNLAAQLHVQVSFEMPVYTANADAVGVLRLLETVRNRLSRSR